MGEFSKVLLAIAKAHTVAQRTLNFESGFCGLNQVYGPNRFTPSV